MQSCGTAEEFADTTASRLAEMPEYKTLSMKSTQTRQRIYDAAQQLFAIHGFEKATIRNIAHKAGTSPALVLRHFGSKEELFVTVSDFTVQFPSEPLVNISELPETLINIFFPRWENGEKYHGLLRSAMTHSLARERIIAIGVEQLTPYIRPLIKDNIELRVALAQSLMLGIAISRYVLKNPIVQELTPTELATQLAPILESIFMG